MDEQDIQREVMEAFTKSGALLRGHFILRSGLRSREFFQCALLLRNALLAAQVCGYLADKLRIYGAVTIVSPAIGGIVVGQEVARHLGINHIFVEKDDTGKLVMRRGFDIQLGEKIVVAEDVVTRGGRVRETIDIIRAMGGEVVGAGAIVDRSGGNRENFGCPFVSLVQMTPETFAPEDLPADLATIPPVKPGSKG